MGEVVRQVPKIMVQEVVKQIQAPPQIVQAAPMVMPTPIVETFAPAPIMSAPIMSAPIVETIAPTYAAAPMMETFAPMTTMAAPMTTMAAPMIGSISTGLPMTTMAAPTMTTMGASPFVGTSYGLPPTI